MTSVLYCIKYEPTYFTTIDQIYDYEERCIGRWIDGKPLYEKTVDFGSLPNATTKEVPHGIEDVDTIWVHDGMYFTPYGRTYPTGLCASPSNYWYTAVEPDAVLIVSSADQSDITGLVIVRYTKTTD